MAYFLAMLPPIALEERLISATLTGLVAGWLLTRLPTANRKALRVLAGMLLAAVFVALLWVR